jgi:hypothetical protein
MYIYRLGHCAELARAELSSLSVPLKYYSPRFAFSPQKQDVNVTGSVVFRAQHLHSFPRGVTLDELVAAVDTYLAAEPTKKIGICAPRLFHSPLMSLAKKQGVKKINCIDKTEPNFGDYKQSKKWLFLYQYQEATHLGIIDQFANQEFWAELDMKMPHRDMKRGIVNLKLARSLYNLAGRPKKWYDPFVGQGRMITATRDGTEYFYGSDRDETAISDAQENNDFSERFWHQKGRFITETPPAPLHCELFVHDVTSPIQAEVQVDSIVSEGYLGKTFAYTPHIGEIKYELHHLQELWKTALIQWHTQKISSIVCCWPYYPKNMELGISDYENMIRKTIADSGCPYELSPLLSGQYTIGYSREHSNTGHLIFKLHTA